MKTVGMKILTIKLCRPEPLLNQAYRDNFRTDLLLNHFSDSQYDCSTQQLSPYLSPFPVAFVLGSGLNILTYNKSRVLSSMRASDPHFPNLYTYQCIQCLNLKGTIIYPVLSK